MALQSDQSSPTSSAAESPPKVTRRGDQNWIRPARRLTRPEPVVPKPVESSKPSLNPLLGGSTGAVASRHAQPRTVAPHTGDPEAMPAEVVKQFVQVGRKYYFPDGARAFTDRGHKLTTPSENTEVVRSLITIAQARGWDRVTVSGTERFRKEAWMAAKLAGLEVKGYQPTQFEQSYLVRAAARASLQRDGQHTSSGAASMPESREPSARQRQLYAEREALILGRLVDHGRATYHHESQAAMSYFVKLETPRGERTVWGVDLERALRESLTQPEPGNLIGLRAVRREAVTVKARERDAEGKVLHEQNLATHRNRWIIEQQSFFATRAAAAEMVRDPKIDARKGVKEHPGLAGTYLYLKGAREVAQRRIRDPEDQRKFVSTVRDALADSVARGEPLPVMRLRQRAEQKTSSRAPRNAERESAPARG